MPLYTEAQTFDRYDLKVGHQTTPDQGRGEETEEEEQKGHSCNIGNAPSLVGKKLKTVICVFWMYI